MSEVCWEPARSTFPRPLGACGTWLPPSRLAQTLRNFDAPVSIFDSVPVARTLLICEIPGATGELAETRPILSESTIATAVGRHLSRLWEAAACDGTATPSDAFRELDDLAADRVRRAIDDIRSIPCLPYRDVIAGRLKSLQLQYSEENDGRAMSADSIRWFGEFLESLADFRKPTLALTVEGYVYAKWRGDRNRLFSAEFYPTGEVSYVVFQPSASESAVNRFSGTTKADALMADVLTPNGIVAWVSDAG